MKRWTRDQVEARLKFCQLFLERAIVLLHEHGQTVDEKKTRSARCRNDRGFTFAQAPRASFYAEQIKAGHHLAGEDIERALRIAFVYGEQLTELLNRDRRYAGLQDAAA